VPREPFTFSSGSRVIFASSWLDSLLKRDWATADDDRAAMSPSNPNSVEVPLAWVGYEDAQITYANQFLIQFQPEEGFVLAIGQATSPPLIGTPEQVAAQAAEIEFVPVRTLTRVAMTRPKLQELIAALEANLQNFDRLKDQIDPRGAGQ
jgi:hypothetical protein